MRAEVADHYHVDPTGLAGRPLAELHALIPALRAARSLRENWPFLKPKEVQEVAERAYGEVVAFALAQDRALEVMDKDE